jgi:hypothetical protein
MITRIYGILFTLSQEIRYLISAYTREEGFN